MSDNQMCIEMRQLREKRQRRDARAQPMAAQLVRRVTSDQHSDGIDTQEWHTHVVVDGWNYVVTIRKESVVDQAL